MRRVPFDHLLVGVAASVAVGIAGAQPAPPIRAGLWEIQVDRQGGGEKMAEMQAKLAAMPPDQRAMVESMMKQRGVDLSGGAGNLKVCIDRDSLAKGRWHEAQDGQGAGADCKTDVLERSTSRWRWHTHCSSPAADADGEATFQGPEAYTVKLDSTLAHDGVPQRTQMTMHSKWLGADCGGVKPIGGRP